MSEIKPGQVYMSKGGIEPYSAIVITEVDADKVYLFDTSSMNTIEQFRPLCENKQKPTILENFFEKYELASLEQTNYILSSLREQREVIEGKISYLNKYLYSLENK